MDDVGFGVRFANGMLGADDDAATQMCVSSNVVKQIS